MLPIDGNNCIWSGESTNQAESSATKANDPKKIVLPKTNSVPRAGDEDDEETILAVADQPRPHGGRQLS